MMRFILLILIVVAAWYGWKHYGDFLQKRPSHEAVIENRSGHEMVRVRLTVDGKGYAKESIAEGASATIPFRVDNDASFTLVWGYADAAYDKTWTGGMVPRGPMLQRHIMTVDDESVVMYRAENK